MGWSEKNNIQMLENPIGCRSEHANPSFSTSNQTSEEIRSNRVPSIVPCYNGKTLKIHEELVVNGLSAISIKHHKGNCKDEKRTSESNNASKKRVPKNEGVKDNKENESDTKSLSVPLYKEFTKATTDEPDCLKDKMKRRNSFWNVHRPELSKLTWPENFVSSAVLQDFFHNHLRIHGTFCEPLHDCTNRSLQMEEEFRNYSKLREIVPPRVLPPDEKIISIMEKSRSVQLNDEDLDPETIVHKSRAEFCVTIGEYIRRPLLKKTTSQQISKYGVHLTNGMESFPLQREGLHFKETAFSEEKVSANIRSSEVILVSSPRSGILKKNSSKILNVGNASRIVMRSASEVDSQRLMYTPQLSLINFRQCNNEVTEDIGDPAGLRTIFSPRDDTAEESGNRS